MDDSVWPVSDVTIQKALGRKKIPRLLYYVAVFDHINE